MPKFSPISRIFFISLMCVALISLSACVGQQKRDKRDDTLRSFEALIRFGNNFEALLNYIHPDYLKENPISSAELNRLNLFHVSGYRTLSVVASDDQKSLTQVVELRLYNRSTARERTVTYPQLWMLDESSERWMMHSGLPDISGN